MQIQIAFSVRILHVDRFNNITIILIILITIFKIESQLKLKLVSEKISYLHFFGLSPALVAELYQRYHHGQTQPSDQDVEDSCYVTKRQSAGLLLVHTHTQRGKEGSHPEKSVSGYFYVKKI